MDDPEILFYRLERPKLVKEGYSSKPEQDAELMRRWNLKQKQAQPNVKTMQRAGSDSDDDEDDNLHHFDEKLPAEVAKEMEMIFVCKQKGLYWYQYSPKKMSIKKESDEEEEDDDDDKDDTMQSFEAKLPTKMAKEMQMEFVGFENGRYKYKYVFGKTLATAVVLDDDLATPGGKSKAATPPCSSSGSSGSGSGKKRKLAPDMDEERMTSMINAMAETKAKEAVYAMLQKCTVPTLKCILEDHKLKVSATNKEEYLSRIFNEALYIEK